MDLTEKSYVDHVSASAEKSIKINAEPKGELEELIEGHLTFGLIFYRPTFTRFARLFTLLTVLMFELLVEGLLFFGFENTNSGSVEASSTLFDDYEAKYFGYTILALAITIPVEIFLIIALSVDRSKAPALTAGAIAFGVLILIASIIGIVMLSFEFCYEWSGYWAISFLWGILIEVFAMQTFYMIVRYFLIQSFPPNEAKTLKA